MIKKISFPTIATWFLKKVLDRGITVGVQVHKENEKTKVNTVFDWARPEHADMFRAANDLKKKETSSDQATSGR